MKKYFYLQLKIAGRLLPFVLGVALALLLGLALILNGLISTFRNAESAKEFTVALAGDTSNEYMQWGLAALQMVDEDKFSITIVDMPLEEAEDALEHGKIAAYVIIPDGFMEQALAGEDIDPITYVTSAGVEGISSFLKREVTSLVTKMVVYSQKGSYGLEELLYDQDLYENAEDYMTQLSLEYTDLILNRNEFYKTQELGVSDGLITRDYYICAAVIVLLMLMGLPFAAIYIKRDYALCRVLRSRGHSVFQQLLCEYLAHLLSMVALLGCIFALAAGAIAAIPGLSLGELPEMDLLILRIIPVLLMISALNMLFFTLSGNMVSGLLLHFFGVIGLCYVSGCIYPVSSFPTSVQTVANLLPTGIARHHISTGFSYESSWSSLGGLMLYTLVFLGIALLVRTRKTTGIER